MQGILHFSPKSVFFGIFTCTCFFLFFLHLGSVIYCNDCDIFYQSAKWQVLSYADQSNNGTFHLHIAVVSTT